MANIKKYNGYFKFEHEFTSISQELNILHISDVHFDNLHCDRKLLKKHLDRIVELDGYIAIYGDLFCLMQGKYDPRSSKQAIRSEHIGGNYIELVIQDACKFFAPYASRILMMSKGNHETSVSSRMEFDILKYFVEKLNRETGSDIILGQYGGYYSGTITISKNNRVGFNVGYHHGAWGGIISKGTQSIARYGLIYPSADIFFSGHTHDSWVVPQPRFVLNQASKKLETKIQWHVKTGTYKDEFSAQEGWAVEKIVMPKYLGGVIQKTKVITKSELLNLNHEFTII